MLRWAVAPVLGAIGLMAVWLIWGLLSPGTRTAPPPGRAYYDPASKLWVTFGPDGELLKAAVSRSTPVPPPPLAKLCGRLLWELRTGAAPADPDPDLSGGPPGWVAMYPVLQPTTRPDSRDLGEAVLQEAKKSWPDVVVLNRHGPTDAGLGGERVMLELKFTHVNGRPSILYVTILSRAGRAYVAWSQLDAVSGAREQVRAVHESLIFREREQP